MSQNDPRWNRIKALFAAAQTVPEAERETFLRERGAGPDTVHEVLDLLGAHVVTEEQPGDLIGPYKLLENLGEGGFGAVWMAEQRAPVQRLVALKVLKAGMDSAQVLARFEQERQALALMQHPNIAQVYDAGTTKHGRPFFVMELVKGIPITDYASRERLTIQQRLELFVQVCRAVQHAHHKGVVHRDIKPRNVLVATVDGRPMAKVIDFGIAKATSGRLTERTLFTEHRAMVGTLEYMSPEQAEGLLDVDTRADVYSLGALLYELLTGSTPFAADKLLAAGFGEMLRTLREVEPERPSVRVSSKAGAGWVAGGSLGGRDPKELFGSLRGDLDWVVMKALEKDRTRRYGTADGLAADLERYLEGEAVEAVPPSFGYRVRKFVRRNRGLTLGFAAVVAAIAVAWYGIWLGFQTADRRLGRVEEVVRNQVGLDRDYAELIRGTTDSNDRFDVAVGVLEGILSSSRTRIASQIEGAELLLHGARISNGLALARDHLPHLATQELDACLVAHRGFEWRYASTLAGESPRRLVSPLPISWCMATGTHDVLFLPPGSPRLALLDSSGQAKPVTYPLPLPNPTRLWALGAAAIVEGEHSDHRKWRACVHLATGAIHTIDPEDDLFLAANGVYVAVRGPDVRLHDLERGTLVQRFQVDRESSSKVQVFPKGRWMLVTNARSETQLIGGIFITTTGPGQLVDLADPARRIPVPGACWINPSGTLHLGEGNWLFDEQTGEVHQSPWAEPAILVFDYPSDQHVLAKLRPDNQWRVVEVRTGQPVSPVLPIADLPDGGVFQGAPSHGHRCFSGFLSLDPLSFETGEWLGPEPGQPDMSAACTDDGLHWIVNRSSALEVTTTRPSPVAMATTSSPVLALSEAPHRTGLAIRATTRSQDVSFVPDTGVPHRRTHPDEVQLAATSSDGQVQLRLVGGRLVRVARDDSVSELPEILALDCRAAALNHTGSNMAVIAGHRLLHQKLATGAGPSERGHIPTDAPTPTIAITGSTIALGQQDGFVQVLADQQFARTTTWRPSEAAVTCLAWSPAGTKLLIGTGDGGCALLRAQDLGQLAKLEGHLDAIRGSAWSPDGSRVFTCSQDGTVRCWRTDPPALDHVLTPLLTLTEPEIAGRPTTLLMTPDGERLACGYDDGSIRVWDSVPWSERAKHVPPLFPMSPK